VWRRPLAAPRNPPGHRQRDLAHNPWRLRTDDTSPSLPRPPDGIALTRCYCPAREFEPYSAPSTSCRLEQSPGAVRSRTLGTASWEVQVKAARIGPYAVTSRGPSHPTSPRPLPTADAAWREIDVEVT